MTRPVVVGALALLLLLLPPGRGVRAQFSVGPDTLEVGGVYVLGGVAFAPFDAGSSTPAWLAQAGFLWQPLPRLGVRLGGIYWDRRRTIPVTDGGCAPDCAQRRRWTAGGAAAEATLYLTRAARVRPFLSAGAAAVQSTTKDRFNFICSPVTQACIRSAAQEQKAPYAVSKTSGGALGGAGVEARLWRATLLGEARLVWLATPGAAPSRVTPLTIGVRF